MNLALADLDPVFLRHERRPSGIYHVHARGLSDAHAIQFLCPVCWEKNSGPVGTHAVLVTFADRGVPDDLGSHDRSGRPSRWAASGSGFDDLTLTPSIDISDPDGSGCGWHGFITKGRVT